MFIHGYIFFFQKYLNILMYIYSCNYTYIFLNFIFIGGALKRVTQKVNKNVVSFIFEINDVIYIIIVN